jgi:ubiquinone biosynthesis protein Coq4
MRKLAKAYYFLRILRGFRRLQRGKRVEVAGAFDIATSCEKLVLIGDPDFDVQANPDVVELVRSRRGTDIRYTKEALSRNPPGSLGAFVAAQMDAGFDPEFYRGFLSAGTTDYEYMVFRGSQLHDALHALTGFPQTALGELGIFAFSAGQSHAYPDLLISVGIAIAHLSKAPTDLNRVLKIFCESWAAGQRLDFLLFKRLEDYFDRPIAEARAALGVPIEGFARSLYSDEELRGTPGWTAAAA